MDHNFTPSQLDPTKCDRCKFSVLDHTAMATCEVCSNSGTMSIWTGMLLCADCVQKEKDAVNAHQTPEKQAERGVLQLNNVIDRARSVDYSIQVRADIFNAATVSISEIKASINQDTTLSPDEKQFQTTKVISDRIEHFQKVLFDTQNTAVEANNWLRVLQQEFNQLIPTLRQEWREKFKNLSPDYKPGAVKSPKESKPKAVKKAKLDMKELMSQAQKLHEEGLTVVTTSALQSICVARNMTPAQAADVMRKTLGGL